MPLMEFPVRPVFRWHPPRGPRSRVVRCGLCGRRYPPFFDVPTEVWRRYIPPEQRFQVVCLACWGMVTEATDGGRYQAARGGPVALWSPEWRVRHGIPEDEPEPLGAVVLRIQGEIELRRATILCSPNAD